MTLIVLQNQNPFYARTQNKLSLSDNFLKHRSISLLPRKEKESLISYEKKSNSNNNTINNSSIIQEPNKFNINYIYTHKNKKNSNIDESILPKATPYLYIPPYLTIHSPKMVAPWCRPNLRPVLWLPVSKVLAMVAVCSR